MHFLFTVAFHFTVVAAVVVLIIIIFYSVVRCRSDVVVFFCIGITFECKKKFPFNTGRYFWLMFLFCLQGLLLVVLLLLLPLLTQSLNSMESSKAAAQQQQYQKKMDSCGFYVRLLNSKSRNT